jgi:hypothetical protein
MWLYTQPEQQQQAQAKLEQAQQPVEKMILGNVP